jgi:hypothetical protein
MKNTNKIILTPLLIILFCSAFYFLYKPDPKLHIDEKIQLVNFCGKDYATENFSTNEKRILYRMSEIINFNYKNETSLRSGSVDNTYHANPHEIANLVCEDLSLRGVNENPIIYNIRLKSRRSKWYGRVLYNRFVK